MARGFGSTLGAGTSDGLASASLPLVSTPRTYAMRYYQNGAGGGNLGRFFDANPSTSSDLMFISTTNINYQRNWSGGVGNWIITAGATGAWHHVAVVYDGGSASNDPVMYLNGVDGVASETNTPSGTIVTGSAPYYIGNRAALDRVWDGMLAEFGIWDAALTATEIAALSNGASPLFIRPSTLLEYIPMIRDNISHKNAAPTMFGTAPQNHPRVFRP